MFAALSSYPGTGKKGMFSYLRDCYALDYRSLAVFRIGVGLVILVDLVLRSRHSMTLYSDAGVLPRQDAFAALSPFRWSVLFTNGTPEFVSLVFWAGFLAATAMVLGWRTRLASMVLWVLVMSFQSRNPHLSSGADTLMRVTLFWAMFLPLGTVWSVDRSLVRAAPAGTDPPKIATGTSSVATFGLIFQVACVYLFTAIQKDGPRWREEGTALYYALGARDVSSSVGDWVFRNAPNTILTALTYASLVIEFAIPLMLLLPLRSGWLRSVGVGLIVLLHLGIGLTMTVGLFPAISIASALGVAPTLFWETVASRVPVSSTAARIRNWAAAPGASVVTGSPPVETSGGSEPAGARLAAESGVRAGHQLHFIYQLPKNRPPLPTLLGNVLAALSIVVVLAWNVQTVSSYETPLPMRRVAIATGLYQNWSMFAPGPQTSTIWFVVEGELESGEKVDLLMPIYTGDVSIRQPVVWDQSNDVVLKDKYWRKYFNAIDSRTTDMLRFAAYTCRTWNAGNAGNDRLVGVTFTRGVASTQPDGLRADPVLKELGSWNCT